MSLVRLLALLLHFGKGITINNKPTAMLIITHFTITAHSSPWGDERAGHCWLLGLEIQKRRIVFLIIINRIKVRGRVGCDNPAFSATPAAHLTFTISNART